MIPLVFNTINYFCENTCKSQYIANLGGYRLFLKYVSSSKAQIHVEVFFETNEMGFHCQKNITIIASHKCPSREKNNQHNNK